MKLDSKEYQARKAAHDAKRKRPKGDVVTDEDLAKERPTTVPLYKDGKHVGRIAAGERAPKGYKLEA